jgi:peptidoglycan/LPS O-acetylase OafA/YrhL
VPEDQTTWLSRLLAPFRRITGSGAFIAEIDGLRFVAIGSVLLFHLAVGLEIKSPAHFARPAGSLAADLVYNGFRGVELFFVISGFILAMPFAGHGLLGKPAVSLRSYFLRRVTRLEPPYVLCMILLFGMHVLFRGRSARELFPHLCASLVYLHNLIYSAESPINNVTWSLEIEIQFYVLTPFLAALFLIKGKALRRSVISALCAVSVVLGWLFIEPNGRAYYSILRFLHFFLVGFLLADVYLTDWKGKPTRGWLWDVIAFVGWPLLFLTWSGTATPLPGQAPGREPLQTVLLVPAAVFLLYCAAFRGRAANRIFVNPLVTTIGGMCYTIYLLHNPALALIVSWTRGLGTTGSYAIDLVVQALAVFPILFVPCAAYFLLVEKPCMSRDWPKRLWRRISSGRPALTPR